MKPIFWQLKYTRFWWWFFWTFRSTSYYNWQFFCHYKMHAITVNGDGLSSVFHVFFFLLHLHLIMLNFNKKFITKFWSIMRQYFTQVKFFSGTSKWHYFLLNFFYFSCIYLLFFSNIAYRLTFIQNYGT